MSRGLLGLHVADTGIYEAGSYLVSISRTLGNSGTDGFTGLVKLEAGCKIVRST